MKKINRLNITDCLSQFNLRNKSSVGMQELADDIMYDMKITSWSKLQYLSRWNHGYKLGKLEPKHIERLRDFLNCTYEDLIIGD